MQGEVHQVVGIRYKPALCVDDLYFHHCHIFGVGAQCVAIATQADRCRLADGFTALGEHQFAAAIAARFDHARCVCHAPFDMAVGRHLLQALADAVDQ